MTAAIIARLRRVLDVAAWVLWTVAVIVGVCVLIGVAGYAW